MSAIPDVMADRPRARALADAASGPTEQPVNVLAPASQQTVPAGSGVLSRSRLVFVNRYYYPDLSATSQMLTDLAIRLAAEGAEVIVVCARQLYDDANACLPANEIIQGVHVHRVATTRYGRSKLIGRSMDYLSFYVAAARKLLSVVSKGDLLVAKTDPPMISLVAAMVARLRGAVLVNWLQDLFPEVATHLGHRLPRPVELLLRWLRDQSLKAAHTNVVIGMRMKERLTQRGIDPAAIHVIENWSDQITVIPASASDMRHSLGLQHKFVVGYSGNLGRAHEYETLLSAARVLRNEGDVVFLMIGGGAKFQQLKRAVEGEGLTNFIFMPYQPREKLADSLAAADVHLISLLPQLEGMIVPSKFYGILAAGRPAIMIGDTDGEVARAIRRHQCGEVVAVGDRDALVSAIWSMKMDDSFKSEAGRTARQAFDSHYTLVSASSKWLSVMVNAGAMHCSAAAAVVGQ